MSPKKVYKIMRPFSSHWAQFWYYFTCKRLGCFISISKLLPSRVHWLEPLSENSTYAKFWFSRSPPPSNNHWSSNEVNMDIFYQTFLETIPAGIWRYHCILTDWPLFIFHGHITSKYVSICDFLGHVRMTCSMVHHKSFNQTMDKQVNVFNTMQGIWSQMYT